MDKDYNIDYSKQNKISSSYLSSNDFHNLLLQTNFNGDKEKNRNYTNGSYYYEDYKEFKKSRFFIIYSIIPL